MVWNFYGMEVGIGTLKHPPTIWNFYGLEFLLTNFYGKLALPEIAKNNLSSKIFRLFPTPP
jgi:hypothetical protein